MARVPFAAGKRLAPKTLDQVAQRLAALEQALEQLTSVPGQFTPQVVVRDTVVGDGENLVSVGTVTTPPGITVTTLAGGEWRTL